MQEQTVFHAWKDIAEYLGRAVRTVQRWEVEFGLPVTRTGHRKHAISVRKVDLDRWLEACTATQKRSAAPIRCPDLAVHYKLIRETERKSQEFMAAAKSTCDQVARLVAAANRNPLHPDQTQQSSRS